MKLSLKTRTAIRDYWYSLEDTLTRYHNLPESKRVELEHLVRDAIEDLLQAKEKQRCDEKNCRFYCSKKLPGHDCYCHKEPVSERNDDDAKKCPYRIPDCPIDYPDVSERNALIDELVGEVDKLIGNLNFKDMVIQILKSKKK